MTLPKLVDGFKTKIVPIVSSVKSADVICKYWWKKYQRVPDAVVIEGPKAGGHLGFTMEELLGDFDFETEIKKIIEHVRIFGEGVKKYIPVIVAGGVYERKDLEHYLELGADGVQIATRFVTTYECDASMEYKQKYIDAKLEDIVIVKSPVGMPGRAILNPYMEKAKNGPIPHGKCHLCVSTCNPATTPYCITEALVNAAVGKVDDALLFCGENAYRATKLEHVKDIMDEFRP